MQCYCILFCHAMLLHAILPCNVKAYLHIKKFMFQGSPHPTTTHRLLIDCSIAIQLLLNCYSTATQMLLNYYSSDAQLLSNCRSTTTHRYSTATQLPLNYYSSATQLLLNCYSTATQLQLNCNSTNTWLNNSERTDRILNGKRLTETGHSILWACCLECISKLI
jgi:hypothetical protein